MSSDRRTTPLITSSDEQSFEATFKRYYPLVYQLAFHLYTAGSNSTTHLGSALHSHLATPRCRALSTPRSLSITIVPPVKG